MLSTNSFSFRLYRLARNACRFATSPRAHASSCGPSVEPSCTPAPNFGQNCLLDAAGGAAVGCVALGAEGFFVTAGFDTTSSDVVACSALGSARSTSGADEEKYQSSPATTRSAAMPAPAF